MECEWVQHFWRTSNIKVLNTYIGSLSAMVRSLPANQETWVWSLGWEDPLEKEMATHSRILAWKIPWMEEPGRLYSPWSCKESDTTELLHFHLKSWIPFLGISVTYTLTNYGASGKEPACQHRWLKKCGFNPWVRKIPGGTAWQPTPVFLLGESHERRSLAG